jgi:hypothetical protein
MPMLSVPTSILARFEAILEKRAIAPNQWTDYKKWLRYFLDFRNKYPVPEAQSEQVRLFIEKLREKKQTLFRSSLSVRRSSKPIFSGSCFLMT